MIAGLLYLFIFISILPFLRRNRGKLFYFRPDIIFSLAFLIYVVPVPLNRLYFDNYYKFDDIILSDILQMQILFVLGFFAGFHIFTPTSRLNPPRPVFNRISNKSISKWVLYISLIFSVILYFIYLHKLGGIASYLSAKRLFIYKHNQGLGIYGVGILILKAVWILFIAKFLMNYYSTGHKKRIDKVRLLWFILLNLLGLILFIVFNLAIGDRRVLLGLIVSLVGILYLYRFVSNRVIVVIGLVLLIFFQVFSKLRHLSNNPGKMIEFAKNKWQIEWLDLSSGESAGHYIVFNDILKNKEKLDKMYGLTYIKAPLIIVPKFVYPDRYQGLSYWFVNKFYPGTAKRGGGFAFSIVAEAYLNFGFLGTFFIGLIFGIIFARIWIVTMFKYKTALSQTIYMLLLLFIITLPRADFSAILKESTISIFLPLAVIFVVSKALRIEGKDMVLSDSSE